MSDLKTRAKQLKLHGLCAHWDQLIPEQLPFIEQMLDWEEVEGRSRGLARRLASARIGRFKSLADFDWTWPKTCNRAMVSDWMQLGFMDDVTNLILVGPNGLGKSTIAQNLAYQTIQQGHSALFVNAANMLGDLAAQDGDMALQRRLRYYSNPHLLVVDEIGYLSYSNRHADLLFEIVNRRYEKKPIIVTTNKPFSEWCEVFPNASCVVSLVDRLVHHSDILVIEGESYRMKEAQDRAKRKQAKRKRKT